MKLHTLALSALILLASPLMGDTTHTVAPGETLYAIARKYEVPLEKLMADNGISQENVTRVRPGTRLLIKEAAPQVPTTDYVVQKGDTFWSLSRRYGLTLEELGALNPEVDPGRLRDGTKLKVPASQASATGQTATPPPQETPQETATPARPAAQSVTHPATMTLPRAAGTEGELWPHPGARTQVKDRNFQHVSIAANAGDPVVAVASGQVTWLSPFSTYGIVIIIQTGTGTGARDAYQFWYAGLADVYVRTGDWVTKGATIARVATTGMDAKPRVAFGVYLGNRPVDHTGTIWR